MVDNYLNRQQQEADFDQQYEDDRLAALESGALQPVPLPPSVAASFATPPDESEEEMPELGEPKPKTEQQQIDELVEMDESDKEYLFGTSDPLIDTGGDGSDIDNLIQPSESDNKFLFDTGMSDPFINPDARPKKRKVRYVTTLRRNGIRRRPDMPTLGEML